MAPQRGNRVRYVPLNEGLEALRDSLQERHNNAVQKMIALAKVMCPVDTGRLQNSIQESENIVDMSGIQSVIGSDVEYANIQEIQQPFLRPAIYRYREELMK